MSLSHKSLHVNKAALLKRCIHKKNYCGAQRNRPSLDWRMSGGCAGGDDDPYTMSWRGIDNQTYYMVDTTQFVQLLNYSGCGNTVSGNHPVTQRLIIDSLKMCAALVLDDCRSLSM